MSLLVPTARFSQVTYATPVNTDIQSAGRYGWKAAFKSVKWLLVKVDNSLFNRNPTVIDNGGNWVASSSGSVSFGNNSNDVTKVKFTTKVNSTDNMLDVFAQTSILGWLGKISIFIEDSSGREIVGGHVTHNQHLDTSKDLPLGTYTTYYVENNSKKWDCWIYQYDFSDFAKSTVSSIYNGTTDIDRVYNPATNKSYVVPIDNKNTKSIKSFKESTRDLTAQELFDEFQDDKLNLSVNRLKNYDVGDDIYVKDVIVDLKYDKNTDVTEMHFGNTQDGAFIWPFAGDLTESLKVGDIAKFKFKVAEEFATNDIIFETLDYFLESYDHMGTETTVNIEDYLVR